MAAMRITFTFLAASNLIIGCAGRDKIIHDYWKRMTSFRGTSLKLFMLGSNQFHDQMQGGFLNLPKERPLCSFGKHISKIGGH
jgi:hypothetical protein